MTAVSDEICIDDKEYKVLLQGIEDMIEPKYKFDGYLRNVELMQMFRKNLDHSLHTNLIDDIDNLTNSTLSLLNSSLSFISLEMFESEFQDRIYKVIGKIYSSRSIVTSNFNNEKLDLFAKNTGYNKSLNQDTH